ncbi:MAG: GGDEF domain-containing protein [Butyrivibrio sp.]|nr:GGDEF domain-containing protein [Butyrivibrio sp.]
MVIITQFMEDTVMNISEKDLLSNLMALLPMGVFWKDRERRFLGANKMFLDYYGLESVDSILGKTDEDVGWHINPGPYRNAEFRVIDEGVPELNVPGQCIVKGNVRDIVASKVPLMVDGQIVGLIGYFMDVTDTKAENERLSSLSNTDELTGLLNRRAFSGIAAKYEKQYMADGTDFVLFMIDLDDFKELNDDYGHEYGNLVLKDISRTLTMACADNSVLFRYGGDEFVVLYQYGDKKDIDSKVRKLMAAIDAPRNLDGMNLSVRASIGYSFYSETTFINALLEVADRHMYEMKREHKKERRA